MILVDTALRQREQAGHPLRIGVIGAGAMARGLVALITNQVPGMVVAAIANRSQCQAVLERSQLPLAAAMADLPQAEPWCLGGGEDFELVLALEPAWGEALVTALPGCQRIGNLVAPGAGDAAAGSLRWQASGEPVTGHRGYSHF
jgi:thiamine-monophosphate kinase